MARDDVIGREGSNRRSFRMKIELLEAAADRGVIPADLRKIMLLKDLAAWEDEARGLTHWSSNSVHSVGGRNPDLHQRWLDVRKRIDLIIGKKRSGKTLAKSKRQELMLRVEIRALLIQNEKLLAKEEELNKRLRQAQRDLKVANDRLATAGVTRIGSTSARGLA